MSGFEVAGIVLGTIPLLIAALEHYHDGVSTIQRWRRYQRERQNLARNLKMEQIKLQNICEELLKGLAPASQIESMIKEPFGTQWKDSLIEARLRARLDNSLDVFQTTISDVQNSMTELARRLGVDPREQVNKTSSFKTEVQRALFAISRSTYTDLISVIRDAISDLETLTQQNISLEPQRQQWSQVRLLTLLRDLSAGFYRALRNSLPCACSHLLKLKLATRSSEVMYSETGFQRLQGLDLHLILCSCDEISQSANQISDRRVWRGLRCHAIPTVETGQATPSKLIPPSTPKASVGKKKRVMWQNLPAGYSGITQLQAMMMSTIATGMPIPVPGAMETKCIRNLCAETSVDAPCDSYGFITDGGTTSARKYMVYPESTINHLASSHSTVSLREVWEEGDTMPCMTYPEKLQLAVTLSSSFLQLSDTPWLSAQISSDHIIFLQHSDVHLYENVFISKATREEPLDLGPPASLLEARRNPALLSMGILLVEIFLGRSLGQDGGAAGQRLERKFREAQALLPRIRLESSNYFSAVSRCLDGELHTRRCDKMQLMEHTYAGVVALLKKDLEVLLIAG